MPESTAQTPDPLEDIRLIAISHLSFLMSVIRCGEQLSAAEEAVIHRTQDGLRALVGQDKATT